MLLAGRAHGCLTGAHSSLSLLSRALLLSPLHVGSQFPVPGCTPVGVLARLFVLHAAVIARHSAALRRLFLPPLLLLARHAPVDGFPRSYIQHDPGSLSLASLSLSHVVPYLIPRAGKCWLSVARCVSGLMSSCESASVTRLVPRFSIQYCCRPFLVTV